MLDWSFEFLFYTYLYKEEASLLWIDYWLHGKEFESQQGTYVFFFSETSRPVLRASEPRTKR
jgi:hypothetical protein